ncbi:alcohol oxidase [Thozetella sp. PMI_491]|nr:alcohol oxidase [Thozetella sp. PMI_491]
MHYIGAFLAVAFVCETAALVLRDGSHPTILATSADVASAYDYVIVGGGTSGLTVADRLTEDGKTSVLVIEYGQLSDSPRISTVQGGFQGMDANFLYDITSVPQVNLRNRTAPVTIGKVLGGSSAVNAMMTLRGAAEDFDRWGSFFGNASEWSWNGLLPYFKRALTFVPPDASVTKAANITYNTAFWGNTSGVFAGWPSYQFPGTTAMVEAFREIPGVEFPGDSGAGRPGVYWYPTFMDPKTVTRSYARTGHYSNYNRSNYAVVTGSKVNKILLNGTTATGVSFVPSGRTTSAATAKTTTVVTARKEVILAAGGIHSPQVLQLSGIGPKKVLAAANISTVVDLPGVGQNFQDHPMLQMSITFDNFTYRPSQDDLFQNATFRSWAQSVWSANKTGPYSIATGNAAAWLPFRVISPRWEEVAANLASQDHGAYLPADTHSTVVAGYKEQMKSFARALRGNNTAFYNAVISGGSTSGALVDLHPLSRGTVNVNPKDPEGSEPIVDYRTLSNPIDTTLMVDMLRFTRRYYMNTTINKQFSPRENSPGAKVQSDADFASYLADSLSPTEFHPVGTCAMLPKALGGVVDEKLKVYGVNNLRIVDGSIMPTLPGGNTCQPVYAVAEKARVLGHSQPNRLYTDFV